VTLLRLEDVSKAYLDGRRAVSVLDGVSLEIDAGEFVGIWGPRRSGKTTLLRVVGGLEQPDSGRMCFDGTDTTALSADERARIHRRDGVRLVSSDWRHERNASVIDHVTISLLSSGMSMREARLPAHEMLERVGASQSAYWAAARLSGAERTRVNLARALVHRPRLLLVDEPAVVLNPSEAVALYELLGSLRRDLGFAIAIASEDVAPLRAAGRLLSLDRGRLRSADTPGIVVAFPDRRASGGVEAKP
jgi:ABC-type lipoprotein export system ATPase subunit